MLGLIGILFLEPCNLLLEGSYLLLMLGRKASNLLTLLLPLLLDLVPGFLQL